MTMTIVSMTHDMLTLALEWRHHLTLHKLASV